MIIAVDVETKGLDCTKFILGSIVKQNCKKAELFYDKKSLWNRILELGKREAKRNKMLNVYSHNATYDFYAYANLKDKNLKYFSHRPFIVSYSIKGKECIKFLDTLSLYRMSLKKLGNLINLKKLEMQSMLKECEFNVTPEFVKSIEPYCIRDSEICLKSVLDMKKKMLSCGINVKRLYTINQIAINYFVNEVRKMPNNNFFFWDSRKGETRRVYRNKEIHGAYRGGRVECFKVGSVKNVNHIDCNSLYPYSTTIMDFPDLSSERMVSKCGNNYLDKIGLSRVLIKNVSNEIGLLPVRTTTGNYYPKIGKYIIGTYTNKEINIAIKNGYELLSLEWTVHYKKAPYNPLKCYMEKLYKLRKSGNSYDSYFFKMMMNACLGKLAQTKVGQEIVVDSVEKADEYLKKKMKIVKGFDLSYMYKSDSIVGRKKYYAPIIPTLVNAEARLFMYDLFRKFEIKNLVYTDTDSLMYKGDLPNNIKIGNGLGEFKVEHSNVNMLIYGRKTYALDKKDIVVSGMHKSGISYEDFSKGEICSEKIVSLNTTNDIKQVGKFITVKRDLNTQLENHIEVLEEYDKEQLFIDNDIEDISFFLDKLDGIV